MSNDLDLPEWVEWSLGKLSLVLVFGGVGAIGMGILALNGNGKAEFSPFYLLFGGPAAVVVGIGLYLRQIWAIVLALLLSLSVTVLCGAAVVSGRGAAGLDSKAIILGVLLIVWDLALLFVLIQIVVAGMGSGVGEWVTPVQEIGPGLKCRVSLTTGQPVLAIIPRHLASDLSWVRPGDEARVTGALLGGYRIVGFSKGRVAP